MVFFVCYYLCLLVLSDRGGDCGCGGGDGGGGGGGRGRWLAAGGGGRLGASSRDV